MGVVVLEYQPGRTSNKSIQVVTESRRVIALENGVE